MKYTLTNEHGNIVNIVEWDGNKDEWQPPDAHTIRPYKDGDSIAVMAEDRNAITIRQQLASAFQTNRDFVALPNLSPAQTLTQQKSTARQLNAIIRILLQQFDGVN